MTNPVSRGGRKPELLAPAGSAEAFFAAIGNGADAVYVGLRRFSARSRAANFTLEDVARMAAACRREGKRLYVALNTLLKARELPEAVPMLSSLAESRVDALIVQDLGLARLAREHFPSLPLHASTQMTVHDAGGVRQAAELGFRRVVLARELTLPEIRDIAAASPIEVECFVHGALCFSISGQCLFSSWLGGRSGNRGDCAQPCRRRFASLGAGDYPFSTRDLRGVESVRALADAGVACLKIEGRMKPAAYVGAASAAYRKLIDARPEERAGAEREAGEILSGARGRRPTAGWLAEGGPAELTDPAVPGAVGEPVGRIERAGERGFSLVAAARFHAGDRLRVQGAGGREGRAFTVRAIFRDGRPGTVARPGERVSVDSPFRFSAGDEVHRIEAGSRAGEGEAACLRKLAAIPPERSACNVALSIAGGVLTVSGTTDDLSFAMEYPVGTLEPARGRDGAAALRGRFAETGDSPFVLGAFDPGAVADRFLPPSRLKEIRRRFYEGFARAALARGEACRREAGEAALRSLELSPAAARGGGSRLFLGVGSPEEVAPLDLPGVDGFLVPLRDATIRNLPGAMEILSPRLERIVLRLPFWLAGGRGASVAGAVDALLASGFRRFEANNLAHFRILRGKGAEVVAGWRTGPMNGGTLRALQGLGASAAILSPEDDGRNLLALLGAELPVGRWLTLFGRLPLMVSAVPVSPVPGRPASGPLSTGGDGLALSVEDGLTVLRPDRPFSILERRESLAAAGCAAFVVELEGTPEASRGRVVESALAGRAWPGASLFNLDREAVA